MRHLFQTSNALLNRGFLPGKADLLGSCPQYGDRIEVSGLTGKPELNGRVGKVVGVLDRSNGRVAVELDVEKGGEESAEATKSSRRLAIKPANLLVATAETEADISEGGSSSVVADAAGGGDDTADGSGTKRPREDGEDEAADLDAAAMGAYSMVYEYEEGDCIFIDNLAIAHRATPEAHRPHTEVGLRILHRTTIKAMINFDPPYGLPPQAPMHGPNPLGQGVWQGGGLGFRWDETIPMQN